MALQALTTDQKELLRSSSKFPAMVRAGAYSKSNYWINTVDPGNAATLPGGVGNTSTYIRWAKSRYYSVLVFKTPSMPQNNVDFINVFLHNLTQAVWDDSVAFDPDTVVINMEENVATMIDPAMDATFDAIIKYSDF